jgi:pimeloyl-ACP methyl ester carboxylesterase
MLMLTNSNEFFISAGIHEMYVKKWISKNTSHRPAILLLHEGLGCTAMWKGFPDKLSAALKMNVYAYDRRGYGKSCNFVEKRKPDYMHVEALVFLTQVLDILSEDEFILLGHSDGGSIALMCQHPKVKAIITIAAHVMVEDITIAGINRATIPKTKEFIIRKLEKYHGSFATDVFNRWVDIWLSQAFRNWDIRPELNLLKRPVLAMQGSRDEYGTVQQLLDIKQHTKSACRLIMFPYAGHSLHRDAESALLYEIKAFLNTNL